MAVLLLTCSFGLCQLNFAFLCKYETLHEKIRGRRFSVFVLWDSFLEEGWLVCWLDNRLYLFVELCNLVL